eukprot:tig00001086_g6868.t1
MLSAATQASARVLAPVARHSAAASRIASSIVRQPRGSVGFLASRLFGSSHVRPAAAAQSSQPLHRMFNIRAESAKAQPSKRPAAKDVAAGEAPALSGADIRRTFLEFYQEKGHLQKPSASLVPEDPTVLLTIAGMLPFKPIFLGQQKPESKRVTTSQKCIRTNDIENVGRTKRHHTFFEMLGNFSFGDYFKEQAIAWAWELVTERFKLPKERLVVSVFREDDEAAAIWRDQIGVPEERIVRLGEADNFWASGPTGPCGPCSEIYYDFHPERGQPIDLEDDTRFIEFYNLVFMQYNREKPDGELVPLASQNIDTGMGLERMAQILQRVPNNYETDLIFPIVERAAELAGIKYAEQEEARKVSLKVVGDHVRSVVHMISDGIYASNIGRGYVLRRLIRRTIRHGRLLGIDDGELFTPRVAEVAIAMAEGVYPHVVEQRARILDELAREEARFLATLERGEKVLEEILERLRAEKGKQISGVDAFTLYDTYGYPLELTQEIAEENGLGVDVDGFEVAMQQQRAQSQERAEVVDVLALGALERLVAALPATEFVGYTELEAAAEVQLVVVGGEGAGEAGAGAEVAVVLDRTPFYAESGGQVGDCGYLVAEGDLLVRVDACERRGTAHVHTGRVERGALKPGARVRAVVDGGLRRRAAAHHTATHLLQAALKDKVDKSVGQAGSLVDFERLRFDFNCNRAVSAAELQEIEDAVNRWISESHGTVVETMPIAEAKAKGATAMFGEKYGDVVRVVDVPGVSMELCGGTHVENTRDIGVFKIRGETGIAAGVRRIEALAGDAAREYLFEQDAIVRGLCSELKARPEELAGRLAALQAEVKATSKALADARGELALAKAELLLSEATEVGGARLLVARLEGAVEADALKVAAERLLQRLGDPAAVLLAAAPAADKVALVAAFSPEAVKRGLNAGKLVGAAAKQCGGGGGGKPNFAQAGGRDASKLGAALEAARDELAKALAA